MKVTEIKAWKLGNDEVVTIKDYEQFMEDLQKLKREAERIGIYELQSLVQVIYNTEAIIDGEIQPFEEYDG